MIFRTRARAPRHQPHPTRIAIAALAALAISAPLVSPLPASLAQEGAPTEIATEIPAAPASDEPTTAPAPPTEASGGAEPTPTNAESAPPPADDPTETATATAEGTPAIDAAATPTETATPTAVPTPVVEVNVYPLAVGAFQDEPQVIPGRLDLGLVLPPAAGGWSVEISGGEATRDSVPIRAGR